MLCALFLSLATASMEEGDARFVRTALSSGPEFVQAESLLRQFTGEQLG